MWGHPFLQKSKERFNFQETTQMNSIRQQLSKLSMAATALTMLAIFLVTIAATPSHAQIPPATVVYDFRGAPNDIYAPSGALAQGRDGDLYGTGPYEAGNNQGGVFKISPAGAETLIASFPASWRGCQGLALGFDGNFYGTCLLGGAHNWGLVFQVTPAGVLTDIYDFTGTANDGTPSWVPVLGANGELYGTSGNGNYLPGNIYRVSTTGVYKNIKSGVGYSNPTVLSAGSDGNFYGAWGNDPKYGNLGSVFKVTAAGTYKVVHGFKGSDPSKYPWGVVLASNGKLYGTDNGGGANGNGAIFSLTTSGKLTDLFDINSSQDGALNVNNLLQATDGNFYGASFGGGSGNQGSFYELASGNSFSVDLLVNGALAGVAPATPLMQHTNGTIFGTTSSYGPGGLGAVVSFDIGASPFISLVGPVPAGAEGAQVQILGQGFDSSSVVEFGGTPATTVQVTGSTFIEATVPTGALTGKVTVTTGSTTLSTPSIYLVTPTIGGFKPPSGPVGTQVTISGTGLLQATKVTFNKTSATFTVNSDQQITATVPTGATSGKISVTTPGGTATSSKSFTVN